MRPSIRLATLAFTAVALAGTLGAQDRGQDRGQGRRQDRDRDRGNGREAPRAQAPRGYTENRVRPDVRVERNAPARAEPRGRNDVNNRGDLRPRNDFQNRNDFRGRVDYRGRDGYRVPIVEHGRPLITRGYRGSMYGGGRFVRGPRYGGFDRFGGRVVLNFGWERPLFYRGYFPAQYVDYCEAVPYDYEYMLPEMRENYDPCFIGDRVVVYDRFSRSIVFVAVIP